MTQVKFCGMTRERDVALAAELGVDYIGLNFSSRSPRRVDLATARRLAARTASATLRVGVFVNEDYDAIHRAVEAARLDLVQLHRGLRAADLEHVPVPIIAVAHVAGVAVSMPSEEELWQCYAILFDSSDAARPGGTGERFDWSLIPGQPRPARVFLAGGLRDDNVAEAIRSVRPAAVDVASGIESAPGVKDPEKMKAFVEAVRGVDGELRAES